MLYGAAEFSRDTDLVIATDPANWQRLQAALQALQSASIAVPPFALDYLDRGHAVHFRSQHPDALNMRVDIMAHMRGVDNFEHLFARRTTVELSDGLVVDVLAIEDLVLAKKTQRDKDWPMIRRLVEAHHAAHRHDPNPERIAFWLRQARTPALLLEVAALYPDAWHHETGQRPLLALATAAQQADLENALQEEERQERERDRLYWLPLKKELEQLRHARPRPPRSPEELNP